MAILQKDFSLNEKYKIMFFIKQGSNAETYRVKGNDGKLYFLKLFNYSKLHKTAFDNENNLLEIEMLKHAKHENIVSYKDSGELIFEGKRFGYLVLDFISGETLAEKISREPLKTIYDVNHIITDVLSGLSYLHKTQNPIIHNEITPQNIMLDLSGNSPKTKIIDFGYARHFHSSTKVYNRDGLNLNFVASECFNNAFSPQSDIYSVGVVMYQLIFGLPPWFKEVSKFQSDRNKADDLILEARNKPLTFPKVAVDFIGYDKQTERILKKALCQDSEERFANAEEFIAAIKREIEVEDMWQKNKILDEQSLHTTIKSKKGNGFADVAGMKELKELLYNRIIKTLKDVEKAKKYKLSIPNGMLLYGPPGCGKTFIAEKFAEETGYNYIYVKSSDLASIYVHGSQEKIGKLFDEARKNAPTVICFDEFDALVPDRNKLHNTSQSGEVNEFLSQLNNCGSDGVFVIASTNKPDLIDNAVLRKGRIDKIVYLPPPDLQAREAMFRLHLKDRPLDFEIDYNILAELTQDYASSDIKHLVEEAAHVASETDDRISQTLLLDVISKNKSSINKDIMKEYLLIKAEMEGEHIENKPKEPTRIGFIK